MSSSNSRFYFLDALRGIAASGVVLHHLFFASVMVTVYEGTSPSWVRDLFQVGAHGVEIFFVLSGFVIAHSLRNNELSLSSLSRFILRRQVRLDPPYWAALVLGLVALWARNHLPGVQRQPMSSLPELALNATYLHELFRLPKESAVLEVAWTLCLEIQFYLLFITILWLCHSFPRARPRNENETAPVAPGAVALMWLSGAACLVARLFVVDAAYFWTAWHFFVAGTLAYWGVTRKTSGLWIGSFLVAFVLSWAATWWSHPVHRGPYMNSAAPLALFVGGATALILWQLGLKNRLGAWQNARLLQYLGRISYSLYLTHMMVLLMVLRLGFKITKNNAPAAWLWMIVCGAICVGVAHVFYLLIERPSVSWASALSKRESSTPVFTESRSTTPAL